MKLYRAIWNVQDASGETIAPGGDAVLRESDALALAAMGAIEPDAIGYAVIEGEIDRARAVLAYVPKLQVADFTAAGALRAESRRRVAAELGFEPSDEEIRAAGEAYAKAQSGNV